MVGKWYFPDLKMSFPTLKMTCKMLASYKKERDMSIYVKPTKHFARKQCTQPRLTIILLITNPSKRLCLGSLLQANRMHKQIKNKSPPKIVDAQRGLFTNQWSPKLFY